MSSRISGITVLTSPHTLDDNRHVYFDATFWLSDDFQLFALLHYYNAKNFEFPSQAVCYIEASVVAMNLDADLAALEKMDGDIDRKEYQLVGELAQVCPAADSVDPRSPPTLSVAAVAQNSSRENQKSDSDEATFTLEGTQWMAAFRNKPSAAVLSVRTSIEKCHRFAEPKKVCPFNNTWVLASGTLVSYSVDEASGRLTVEMHISQPHTLAYLGKFSPQFASVKNPGAVTLAQTGSTKHKRYNYGTHAEMSSPIPRKRARAEKENAGAPTTLSSVPASH